MAASQVHYGFQVSQVNNGWVVSSQEHVPWTEEEKAEFTAKTGMLPSHAKVNEEMFVFVDGDSLIEGLRGLVDKAEMMAAANRQNAD